MPGPAGAEPVSARSREELESALGHLESAPAEAGTLTLLVRRPARFAREVLTEGLLDPELGLIGDNWLERATRAAIESGRHLEAQLNVMGSRMIGLLGETDEDRAAAGDQLFMDLDLSEGNLPVGARLAIGETAVIEVTSKPHRGCAKFVTRYGADAAEFVNSELGRQLRLRGLNARVVTGGVVRPGDRVRRVFTAT